MAVRRNQLLLLLLCLMAAGAERRRSAPRSPRGGSGPWWPGNPEDNLGTYPVPPDAHPPEALPPLK